MLRTTLLPALALSALVLSGCGGGSDSSAAPATSAPAASAPVSTAPTAAESTPAASPSTGTAEVKDACKILDADAIEDLTDVEVKKGTTQSVGGSTVCTWLPEDGSDDDAAVFSAQEGPLQGSLTQVEDQLKTQFDGKVSKLTVSGADDARYVTGKKSGLNVIDVIAQKGDVFYQVLVATPRDAGQHKDGAIKIAEALLKA